MYQLSDDQKVQILQQVAHYLEMDCYDFGVSVGPFSLMAGELAKQAEAAMMELAGEEMPEDEEPEEVTVLRGAEETDKAMKQLAQALGAPAEEESEWTVEKVDCQD